MIACLRETWASLSVVAVCDMRDGHAGLHYDRRLEYAWAACRTRGQVPEFTHQHVPEGTVS